MVFEGMKAGRGERMFAARSLAAKVMFEEEAFDVKEEITLHDLEMKGVCTIARGNMRDRGNVN